SHILPELADICNKIGIIDRGVMTVNAEVAQVKKLVRERTVLNVQVKGDMDAAARLLEDHTIVDAVETGDTELSVVLRKDVDDYSDLPTALIQAGHKLTLFREEEVNLESAFMALTKGMGEKT
ncbi:MAG: multidrug ABC transporter ATP-binding protein, partial [Pirellulaceae bacterium]